MRRLFLLAIGLILPALPAGIWAQESTVLPVVAFLLVSANPNDPAVEAFREGLHELGYIDGRNIKLEYRRAEGHVERLPRLAQELVELKVDVIVVGPQVAARAAREATSTIPIVIAMYDYDPMSFGLIESFSRPGGNITGIFARGSELIGKRLELLKETLPGVSRVGVFWDSFGQRQVKEIESAARSLGVRLTLVELRDAYDFQAAFQTAKKNRVGAVMPLASPVFYARRARIASLALENRMPTMFGSGDFTDTGALMSYGPDNKDTYGRVAYFIDRLLKGAKPGDLPVEQASKFKLIVNLKTAKALGITFPESILLRADEVIR
jgi:ABC-type uncharacterized transport system substrate-binding protein